MVHPLLLATAALLVLPAAAQAGGTVAVDGQRVVMTGTPGPDTVLVARWPATGELYFQQVGSAQGTGPSEAGPGCTKENRFAVSGDERIFCPAAGISEIVVDAGAGDDTMVFDLRAATPYDIRADAGSGDDEVADFTGGATIQLGDGDDTASASKTKPTTVFGGAGNDDLLCGDSSGAGRAKARRVLDGGPGKDRLCGGLKDDRLSGGAGDDKVYAGEGDDVLDGGAGDDLLEGGDDADRITGGAGEDEIDGGSGKDLIRAKDREQDEVDGGSKRDTVHADRADDLTRCEIIRRA